MASGFRRFIKKVFIVCNIIVAAVFLLACLVPYLNPQTWWFMSILGLGFPFLLLALLLFLIFWLFVKRKFIFISIIAMLIGWKSITLLFSFHQQVRFDYKKPSDRLRIVTWNVARFIELKRNTNEGS